MDLAETLPFLESLLLNLVKIPSDENSTKEFVGTLAFAIKSLIHHVNVIGIEILAMQNIVTNEIQGLKSTSEISKEMISKVARDQAEIKSGKSSIQSKSTKAGKSSRSKSVAFEEEVKIGDFNPPPGDRVIAKTDNRKPAYFRKAIKKVHKRIDLAVSAITELNFKVQMNETLISKQAHFQVSANRGRAAIKNSALGELLLRGSSRGLSASSNKSDSSQKGKAKGKKGKSKGKEKVNTSNTCAIEIEVSKEKPKGKPKTGKKTESS